MRYVVLFLLYFLSGYAHSQTNAIASFEAQEWATKVSWFLPAEQASKQAREQYTEVLLSYCKELVKPNGKTALTQKFLQRIFRQTHKRFLTTYSQNTPFARVFEAGKFDCVASTALFALVLEYVGYAYNIIETPNHVYLKVQTTEGTVLLETTNATQGFIKFESEIKAIEQSYQALAQPALTLKELAGLQFYNSALSAMQAQNYQEGNRLLRKAQMLYTHSERVERLAFLSGQLEK